MLVRVGVAALLAAFLGVRGIKKRSLDASGAAAAFVVGFLTLAVGYHYGALLLGFYFSGSKLTKVRADVKQQIDGNYKPGGQRDAAQVLACSALATVIAVYVAFAYGDAVFPIDFAAAPLRSHLLAGFVGHYACCAADTWASELGVLSQGGPRLITTFRRVPPGTNGGVSLLGTAASALGGAFIGVLYYVATALAASFADAQPQVIALGTAAGLFGSAIDSLLGATLQASYYDRSTRQICAESSVKPRDAEHLSGVNWLSNAQVNVVSVVVTTALSGALAQAIF